MNTLTHEEISQQAQQLWQNHGCPAGRDTEIWLEAEQKLNQETAAESVAEDHVAHAQPKQKAIKAAVKKDRARAPQVPHNIVPKPMPAETSKPLWPQPQSS